MIKSNFIKKSASFVAVIMLFLFTLISCGSNHQKNVVDDFLNHLKDGKFEESLVYLSDNNYVSNVMLGNLFEGLVNLTPDGDISSGLAERYTISSDGLEYRFYIRNDAYMSTGKQITSQDFLNFFKDILDKDKDKFYYDELKFIVGVDEYYKGEILF